PHMGHVLEKVLADVCARWFRLRGDEVRFQIGTDEHGIKIQQTADREKMTPRALVDRNVPLFQDLYKRLGISADVFIRTSDQKTHWPTVIELWKRLQAAGVLEKRTYTGLYCTGCERFITKKELIDGKCPDHQIPPLEVQEENWFFLLSKEQEWLTKLLKKEYTIVPSFREKETTTLLEGGLEDVSFSRPKSSLSWGVPVPGDDNQTMYVWCDALTNYISGLGLLTDHAETKWWDDANVMCVIGKDIARFHALIWPAMLKHAKIRTPDKLLIHGFLTSEGQKMSKSIGNVVVPDDVISKYGVDALRFYLSHEIPVGNDGDFSWKRFGELYDAKLRNQLGNLLNRVLVLLKKEGGTIAVPESATDAERAADGWKDYEKKMNAFDLHGAVQQAFELIASLNMGFDKAAPWKLAGEERLTMLSRFAESIRLAALLLLPFIPDAAQKISRQLNVSYAEKMLDKEFIITKEMKEWGSQKEWKQVGDPAILFAPIEV
ncbi:MAG: methionine--tRNA ligase, partial [Candidatus Peribacteraceae bacterium]|nr:methionine--tRNA ligase [Candidatus Peribacteraceae bacterium]